MVLLEDEAGDAIAEASERLLVELEGVLPVDAKAPGARAVESADQVKKGALARARGSHDRRGVAGCGRRRAEPPG
jgi:hypothetical protein